MSPLTLYARARIYNSICARDRGCSVRPAFPTPSLSRVNLSSLGRIAPRAGVGVENDQVGSRDSTPPVAG